MKEDKTTEAPSIAPQEDVAEKATAVAVEPTGVDLTEVIKDRYGKSVYRNPEAAENKEAMTIRDAILLAIDGNQPGDEKLESKEKIRLDKIGELCDVENTHADFTAEQTTKILERALKIFNSLVYGRLVDRLDPKRRKDA